MSNPLASILIPHYNTPRELNLCLACLAHYTAEEIEILVVDNGSTPEALDQLVLPKRTRILSRQQSSLDQRAHLDALDMGIDHARGRFLVGMHSDAYVLDAGWLAFLVELLEPDVLVAGPTTHKLYRPALQTRITRAFQKKEEPGTPMIRPLFAIYRPEIFENVRFADFDDVGDISVEAMRQGRARTIPDTIAMRYVYHLGGTTRLSAMGHRKKAKRLKEKQFARLLATPAIRAVPRPPL